MKFEFTLETVKMFVKLANEMDCEILLKQGHYTVDAKSILGILSIDLLAEDLELELPTKELEQEFLAKLIQHKILVEKN